MGAYLTGVAVTSAPWLLTTFVLVMLRVSARSRGHSDFQTIENLITAIYALTVVLSAPIHVVVSRYAADRLYEKRLDMVAAPLRRALAATLLLSALLGAGLVAFFKVDLLVSVGGIVLTIIVAAQWLLLSVGGGLSSPGVVLRAFGIGAPASIFGSLLFERTFNMGALGYLVGFGLGQFITLAMLLAGIQKSLPPEADEGARLLPAFSEYKILAASSFAYHAAIWIDKVVIWAMAGREAASLYAASAALAWFSVIPAFAWIYVQIETTFYQRFRRFYDSLQGGASLHALRAESGHLGSEALRILKGAGLVQGAVTVLAMLAAPHIVGFAGLPTVAVLPFRMVLVGAALQVMTLLGLLMLYYFDLRRDALAVAVVLLITDGLFTAFAIAVGWPPAIGYVAAGAVACALTSTLVQRRLSTLLVDTFQGQPFSAEL